MAYSSRLRVRLRKGIVDVDLPAVLSIDGLPPIEVTRQAGPKGCGSDAEPAKPAASEFHIFICRGFPDEASASAAGRHLANALLVVGAIQHLGTDIGFDRSSLQFSQVVNDAVRARTGKELRAEVLGLMTYEDDSISIMGMNGSIVVETKLASVQQGLREWVPLANVITDRQRVCAALLNDAHFASQVESQFVLLVTAVESLCDQYGVGPDYLGAIESLTGALEALPIDDVVRESLKRMLKNARRQSVRQAYMGKIGALLGAADAKTFDRLYQSRSSFVHDGRGRGDLQDDTNTARDLGVRLLQADIVATSQKNRRPL